jgi:TonB family protein
MSNIESWVLGYLLNSLWQVPVIFTAGWFAARLMRRTGPRMEHRVWVVALLLEVFLPACHLRLGDLSRELWALLPWGWKSGTTDGGVRVAIETGTANTRGMLRLPEAVLAVIAVAYGSTLLYFAGRLAWGLWKTHTMQQRAQLTTLTGETAQKWGRCSRAFGIDTAEIATSSMISGPVTVGVRRGVLLVPPGFLERVDDDDLDAVIAHEFAHMKRRDFAKNLLYGVLSLPVAYHPLFWLTRSRVAESREMVCDVMAAEAVAGRERYARSLLRLASMLATGTPARTLHAIGIFDANIFERRVMNLTQRRIEIRGAWRFAMAAACAVIGLATCASALALRMEVSAPVEASGGHSGSPSAMKVAPEIIAGNILYKTVPKYPADAKAAHVSGEIVLQAIISKEGIVQNLRVVRGPQMLRTSALDAVREWKYKPYLLNGNPVEVDTTVTVTYSLDQ